MNTTESFLFTCKFCRKPQVTKWHPNSFFTEEKWRSLLACNRCSDFRMAKLRYESAINKLCTKLHSARTVGVENINVLQGVIEAKLTEITKKLSEATCAYHMLQPFWDHDFVLQLLERPDIAWKICRNYQSMIAHHATTIPHPGRTPYRT